MFSKIAISQLEDAFPGLVFLLVLFFFFPSNLHKKDRTLVS